MNSDYLVTHANIKSAKYGLTDLWHFRPSPWNLDLRNLVFPLPNNSNDNASGINYTVYLWLNLFH